MCVMNRSEDMDIGINMVIGKTMLQGLITRGSATATALPTPMRMEVD